MVETSSIDTLLQNGYWRAKSPDSRFFNSPIATSSYSYNDRIIPRTSSKPFHYGTRPRIHLPPPMVEDEVESLAKEHGSVVSVLSEEQPQNRGDIDQNPVILEVHEHNPERRFVLVHNSSDSSDESADTGRKVDKQSTKKTSTDREPSLERRSSYEANTCRKYVILTPEEEEEKRKRDLNAREKRPGRERERRRSRLEELPTIITNLGPDDRQNDRPRDIQRAESATGTRQSKDDYFSPRRGTRNLGDESLLSPDVIKHSTKGRDRAYWDYNGASMPVSPGRTRASREEPQYDHRSLPNQRRAAEREQQQPSTSPVMTKRHSAYEVPVPRNTRRTSNEGYENGRPYVDMPSSRRDGKPSSPPYPRLERESMRPRSSSFRSKRDSPPYDDNRYSSGEEPQQRGDIRRRRKSVIHDKHNGYLATPTESRPDGGRRSKTSSPLESPRVSQSGLWERDFAPSPRSATFPPNKESMRYPNSDEETHERHLSRASTARSAINTPASMSFPVITAAAAAASVAAAAASTVATDGNNTVDCRRSNVPPPPKGRPTAISRSDSRSPTSTHSSTPPIVEWQPSRFDLVEAASRFEQPITSYRRYSEDANKGELPDLPDCPRTREEAGHVDWLTLPRCNNFNICPSCYQSAFQNTKFKHHFVPAPFRPRERPLKCDFGTSQWYHIAWLLTHKYNQPDLRLLLGIANVSAANQPCTGPREAYRIWYTIRDPVSQRPVRNFNICHHCAKTIEVLLPNLSGVFVPLDSPAESTRGICDMHQEGHGGGARKRFVRYFDDMETISDNALSTNSAPDITALAEKIRGRSAIRECWNARPVRDGRWYMMRSLPDVTVCEECFFEVVYPLLQRCDSGVPGNFYHEPQHLPIAACQLYSQRMRDVFYRASRRNDLRYFESRIQERRAKEHEVSMRLSGLDREVLGAEWVDEEIERIQKEWRKWE
ncbi:uncharacterized protein BCR38DRAFT_479760 [Pseudomassariella vexata]|uniref:Uncharacterized protein n=1 Tax=Pseudomassariella vexata TaxID=1141098 RepID=A0A1Y2EII0_9PEZI|nr:uncharacterized protein BCR38DRAFT_479760 [Pseudomassariella vexata]ORY71247.1 hypothetical protein BCR38DRAFT_479760 [Pseudomassariella vexata]